MIDDSTVAAVFGMTLGAVIWVASCAAFVGPANQPVACPINCGNGVCCEYDQECSGYADRPCKPGWVSTARDSGAD